jgi:spermidine synthase
MTEPLLGPNRIWNPFLVADSVSKVVNRSRGSWFLDVESDRMLNLRRVKRVLFESHSPFQLIQMVEMEDYGRTLILDGRIQMAESDEHIYHEMFVHPVMVWGRYETVLVLGGGDGCLARELLKWPCVKRILIVELDEVVLRCFREDFKEMNNGAFGDPRVEVLCDDATKVLQLDERWDLVLADLTEPYDDSGVAGDLSSGLFNAGFWSDLQVQINPGGILAAQTGGLRLGKSSLDPHHVRLVRMLEKVFGHVRVAYEFIPSYESWWTITFAAPEGFGGYRMGSDLAFVDEVDEILEHEAVETRYYDGLTHVRLFAPPVSQELLYGWGGEQM